jgi:hypothetical protein
LNNEFLKASEAANLELSNALYEIEKLRAERPEIERTLKSFHNEFEIDQRHLNSIITPDHEQDEWFKQIDRSLTELKSQKKQVLEIIEVQKKALKRECDAKLDQETDRHSRSVLSASMGTEKEKIRLEMLQEISAVVQSCCEEAQNLNELISAVTDNHEKQINQLATETLVRAKSTEEIDLLRAELEKFIALKSNGAMEGKREIIQVEHEWKAKIAEEKSSHTSELKSLDERITVEISEFEITKTGQENEGIMSKNEFERSCKEFKQNADVKVRQLIEEHLGRAASFEKDCESVNELAKRGHGAFQKKLRDGRSQYQSSLDECQRSATCEAEKRHRDWEEMRLFYEEKVAVLMKKRDDAIELYEKRPARQSELDVIEQLQALLQSKTMLLQNALKEVAEYRTLMIQQEKDVNQRFGKGPKVGVLGIASAERRLSH